MKARFAISLFAAVAALAAVACSAAPEQDQAEESSSELGACTMIYLPVCGIDGKTYPNKCVAGKVPIAYETACVDGGRVCPRPCVPGPTRLCPPPIPGCTPPPPPPPPPGPCATMLCRPGTRCVELPNGDGTCVPDPVFPIPR